MDSNPQDRRQFGRLNLLAYGQDKECVLEVDGARLVAQLIDISAGGARLRWGATSAGAQAKAVIFSVSRINDSGQLQGLAANIRWRNEQEFGIQFVHELDIPVSTLQKLVF